MSPAPFATVLVPTHDHSNLIPYALKSIQAQTFRDFELFVIGDGAPPATREVVQSFARSDRRIRYFDFPKGERHGELHRHVALEQAQGRIVAYCGDDDLWLPQHLDRMAGLLDDVDFGHAVQVNLRPGGEFVVFPGSFSDPDCWRKVRDAQLFFFGLTVGGHRMSAYRQLPEGWSPAPPGVPTDQFMWRKFMRAPGLRFGTHVEATAIHITSPLRLDWTAEEREEELSGLFRRRTSRSLRLELEAAIRKSHPGWTPPQQPWPRRLVEDIADRWRRIAGLQPPPS